MSHKTVILHIKQSMSHAPSLVFPSYLSTTSLSSCTLFRPSARPSLLSTSHGDLPCADPSNVSSGSLAETHSPTGYEPKDLTEESNSILVKPMFFQRPSMTSTCDSVESIATPPPEPDLDDEQIRNCWLHCCSYRRERQVPTDHECQVHLTSEKVQGNLPQCSHTKES